MHSIEKEPIMPARKPKPMQSSGKPDQPPLRTPEPSMGPDEEGEIPLTRHQIPKDHAAWVHEEERKPHYSGQEVRQGEIILKKRRNRIIFISGLALGVLFLIVLQLMMV
jgi:hypothetical protein